MPRNRQLDAKRAKEIDREFYANGLAYTAAGADGKEIMRLTGVFTSARGVGEILKMSAKAGKRTRSGGWQGVSSVVVGGRGQDRRAKAVSCIMTLMGDLKDILEEYGIRVTEWLEGAGNDDPDSWQEVFRKAGYSVYSFAML